MHTGSGEPVEKTAKPGARHELNAEQPTPAAAPAKGPAISGPQSKRPWAVRQKTDPAWVEKVEQF